VSAVSRPPLQILVLSHFRPGNANVIRDFLFSFNAYSQHRYYYCFDCSTLDEGVDFSRFDVILVFWSLREIEISAAVRQRVRAAPALKVAFLQDEYRYVWLRNETMRQLGVNVIFTCVAERDHATFYGRSRIDTLEATYTVLTGYVPAYLEGVRSPSADRRRLDVSYRSRMPPFFHGDLGQEKLTIAERFRDICQAHDLRADISVRESDRIYGRAWVRFLRHSRCVLGVPSGSSVADFDGRIREQCDLLRLKSPGVSYQEVKARVFADVDGKVVVDTVSPRVFESTALGCTMVNHEGGYGGILEPDRHYIRVKRDYSNVAEVVDRIRDRAYCRTIAANAHRDLVSSGQYSYRRFAQEFDEHLERHTRQRVAVPAVSRVAFYARRQRLGQRFIIPRGLSYVAGPITALGFSVGDAVRGYAQAGQLSSVAWRCLLDPMRFLHMGIGALQTLATTPVLWALLRVYLRTPQARAKTSLLGLTEELLRIDVVRRLRGGIPPSLPFGVDIEFNAQDGILVLKGTVASDHQLARANPLPADIDAALLAGRVRAIIWTYTPAASSEPWPRAYRPRVVGLGRGTYRFDALAALSAFAPDAAPALRAILSGEPSPREQRLVMAATAS
jgi:hypothetical protein